MPQFTNQEPASIPPHLTWILNISPAHDTRCAGYNYANGRRCSMTIDYSNVETAITLLDFATDEFNAGICINDHLTELSRHVLCTRYHQYQSERLVGRWKRVVEEFDSNWMISGTVFTTIGERDPFGSGRGRDRNEIRHPIAYGDYGYALYPYNMELRECRYSRLKRRLWAFVEWMKNIQVIPRICSNRPDVEEFGDPGYTQNWDLNFDDGYRPADDYVNDGNNNDNTYTSYEDGPPHPVFGRTIISPFDNVEGSYSNRNEGYTRTRRLNPSDAHAQRQPIEGDCSICLLSLSEHPPPFVFPGIDMAHENERARDATYSWGGNRAWGWEDHAGRTYAYYLEGTEPLPFEEGEESAEPGRCNKHESQDTVANTDAAPKAEPQLAWCRAECGINYHKSCIDHWLATARFESPSCPTCRREWVDFAGVSFYLVN